MVKSFICCETLSTQHQRCASFNRAIKNVRRGLRNPYYFRVEAAAEVNVRMILSLDKNKHINNMNRFSRQPNTIFIQYLDVSN